MTLRALAASLALAAAAHAAAEPPPAGTRLALERLRTKGVAVPLAEAVEERICQALTGEVKAEVVCPTDLAAAAYLAKSQFLFGECTSEDCVKRVEAASAADRRVRGALERGPKGIVLTLHLVGPDGEGPRVEEALPEDLDGVMERVAAAVKRLVR